MDLGGMRWRLIGPFRGGRPTSVVGHPTDRLTFYFGACAGGIFKTTDAGASWIPISDGYLKTGSVGALAISEVDPNILYAAMGDTSMRDNVSHGDGVYKSTDAGSTWKHVGLTETRHISRVRLDPRNPDVVYVSALGHAWGHNEERGVYRSRNGGQHWEQVLSVGPTAGACDLAMDPTNPRILYAGLWETIRTPYYFSSGGPKSGIFKSVDGGDTWRQLERGLPTGVKGRIGITVSRVRPNRVWTVLEAQGGGGGVYRSDDAGETWRRLSDSRDQLQRPWYFMHIFADTENADTIYTLSLHAWKSIDGGQTFSSWPMPHGDDHDLWIDPHDAKRMIGANDGGACVSFDGGLTWSNQYNQPTGQFYHIVTDREFPCRVYGSQQDYTTISVPTWSDSGAITRLETYPVGASESAHLAVRQDDPSVVYGGSYGHRMTRYDHRSGQLRDIAVWPDDVIGWPAKDVPHRFNWTFPVYLSPHDQNVLYAGGNRLHRTVDEGASWETISPDLTRHEERFLRSSGGPITQDNYTTEYYCTIFAVAESPVEKGVLWVGSDDGLIHVSHDSGTTWVNVTPDWLPELALVCNIEPSPHDLNTCYVACTRYKLDDPRPFLLKTVDAGKTWKLITNGLRDDVITRVVRADPAQPGLLFAGAESGIFYSVNDGEDWLDAQLNLPVAPVHDLAITWQGDLVAATHGRAMWVLDDLTPVRALAAGAGVKGPHLLAPRTAFRLREARLTSPGPIPGHKDYVSSMGDLTTVVYSKGIDERGDVDWAFVDAGVNAPVGVWVHYVLPEDSTDEVKVVVRDDGGVVVHESISVGEDHARDCVPRSGGLNRFIWDMRLAAPTQLVGQRQFNYWARGAEGPLAAPGAYMVELWVAGRKVGEEQFRLAVDPRAPVTEDDVKAQVELSARIVEQVSKVNEAINVGRAVAGQLHAILERATAAGNSDLAAEASDLAGRLEGSLGSLTQDEIQTGSDFAAHTPMLDSRLLAIGAFVGASDYPPTNGMRGVYGDLEQKSDEAVKSLRSLLEDDVAAFAQRLAETGVMALDVPSREG